MASGQTTNYGLNQWAAEDKVIRTEFNEDNAKIDAALSTMPKFITGSYVGTGTQETIHYPIGARPKLLLMISHNWTSGTRMTTCIASEEFSVVWNNNGFNSIYGAGDFISFDEEGFSARHSAFTLESGFNVEGKVQRYLVIC